MIKKDIAQYLYERHGGLSRDEMEHYTDEMIELLKEITREHENVTITHFGRFRHKPRKVREIHLPSGDKALSSSLDRLQFLPSPALKTYLNSSVDEESED